MSTLASVKSRNSSIAADHGDEYILPVKLELSSQIRQSVHELEGLLDKWQNKIHSDVESRRIAYYAFPDIVKYLMIQYQEYLNTLQSIQKLILPNIEVVSRSSMTITSKKEKKRQLQREALEAAKTKPILNYQALGFVDQVAFDEFKGFLIHYLAFNNDIMELLLTLASLRCFDLEPKEKFKDSNLSHRLSKYAPMYSEEGG